MNAILQVVNLRTVVTRDGRDIPVVRDVSFDLAPGETVALVGESGSGKTLTALSVMGLLPPAARVAAGAIRHDGRDLLRLSPPERRAVRGGGIAMIYQDPAAALNPLMRVGAQIKEGLTAHGTADPRARTLEVLDQVGLPRPERIARAYPHQISGGQRQRVMIAMALAPRPRVLIADEPTTALDSTIQHQILTLIGELARGHDLAVLWITHDLGVVARIAGRVMVMYAGRVVERAGTGELFRAPRHPYTAGLLAALPPPRAPRREPLAQIGGVPPDPAAPPPGCSFAPRCPRRVDRCRTERPVLAADRSAAACWAPLPGPEEES